MRFAGWLLFIISAAQAGKVLVLYENPQIRATHSTLFETLEATGDDLQFKVRVSLENRLFLFTNFLFL